MTTQAKTGQMTRAAAGALGRALADGRAREMGGQVYGPWQGRLEDMRGAVDHADPVEHERLAVVAYQAACRRWAELVLDRGRRNLALVALLAEEETAVGLPLADGTYAWPGDAVEWVDPVTGAPDSSPWIVKDTWDGGCMLVRRHVTAPLLREPELRRVVGAGRMARLQRWKAS